MGSDLLMRVREVGGISEGQKDKSGARDQIPQMAKLASLYYVVFYQIFEKTA